jgi:hypothetical protein
MANAPFPQPDGDRGSAATRVETEAERRAARLAELVSGLTGCEKGGALHAVREQHTGADNGRADDALEVVARAMVEVEAPPPEGFRFAGFLREDALVQHGSLRRWDRLHHEEDRVEDQIVTINLDHLDRRHMRRTFELDRFDPFDRFE